MSVGFSSAEIGVEVKLRVVHGAGHGFDGPEIMDTVRQFFDVHLKRKPPTGSGRR